MQNINSVEIHQQLAKVYKKGVMNKKNIHKWCKMFNEGITDVRDESKSRQFFFFFLPAWNC